MRSGATPSSRALFADLEEFARPAGRRCHRARVEWIPDDGGVPVWGGLRAVGDALNSEPLRAQTHHERRGDSRAWTLCPRRTVFVYGDSLNVLARKALTAVMDSVWACEL
jgi:hypothetical protein